MKKIYAFLFLMFWILSLAGFTQSTDTIDRMLISAAGGSNVINGKIVSFSVGEVVVTTISNSKWIVSQGFNQPDPILINSIPINKLDHKTIIYPNPTPDYITIKIEKYTNQDLDISIYDLFGNRLETEYYSNQNSNCILFKVDLRNFAVGTYILRIISEMYQPQIFKVVKCVY